MAIISLAKPWVKMPTTLNARSAAKPQIGKPCFSRQRKLVKVFSSGLGFDNDGSS
jgi:hypothetical protein